MEISMNDYRRACTETYVLLTEYCDDEITLKVPEEKIEFYKRNMDQDYSFKLDKDLELDDQIMYLTKCIFANLFKKFIATPEDKQKIALKEKVEYERVETEKRERYNPDDIFKKKNVGKTDNVEKVESTENNVRIERPLVENITVAESTPVAVKESFFSKVIDWIKGLFK